MFDFQDTGHENHWSVCELETVQIKSSLRTARLVINKG